MHFILELPIILESDTGTGKTRLIQVFQFFVKYASTCETTLAVLDVHPGQQARDVMTWLQEKISPWIDSVKSTASFCFSDVPQAIVFVDEVGIHAFERNLHVTLPCTAEDSF